MGQTSMATIPLALNGVFVAGVSPAMVTLESVLAEIAVTNIPILLTGEIGTGKETFARRIHELSMRRDAPLIRVACASMDVRPFLGDVDLNGDSMRSGSGTIFFDEISELDTACQRKLLYALPDGDSGLRNGCLSARVISTTSRNLEDEVRAGRFRSELFYRINGVCLRLHPLRDRKEDIEPLAECFLTKHATQLGRPRPTLSARTREALVNYLWPGNIRELENVVKKIVALNDESLAISELSQSRSNGRSAVAASPSYSLKAAARAASREAERELILKALARTRWNRKRAAQELQISYKSLLYKLKQIGLQDTETN
jgi:two-component system response regulator AtoC